MHTHKNRNTVSQYSRTKRRVLRCEHLEDRRLLATYTFETKITSFFQAADDKTSPQLAVAVGQTFKGSVDYTDGTISNLVYDLDKLRISSTQPTSSFVAPDQVRISIRQGCFFSYPGRSFSLDLTGNFGGQAKPDTLLGLTGKMSLSAIQTEDMVCWFPPLRPAIPAMNVDADVTFDSGPKIEQVVPTYGAALSASTYGTYLRGVSLVEKFTVTSSTVDGYDTVKYSINGSAPVNATRVSGSIWTFTSDIGKLPFNPAGNVTTHSVKVTMLKGTTQISAQTISLRVLDSLSLDLDVRASIDLSAYQELEGIRLIDGIQTNLDFKATISGANLLPVYKNRLAIEAFKSGTQSAPASKAVSFNGNTATFNLLASTFPDFNPDSSFDWDFFLVPAAANRTETIRFNSTPEQLFVTALPIWMGSPSTKSFRALTADDPAFAQTGAAYVIEFPIGVVDRDLDTTIDMPFGLLNNLQSNVTLGGMITAYAKLDSAPEAILTAKKLSAKTMLLGKELLNKDFTLADGITVTGQLNGKTLEGSSIQVTLPDKEVEVPDNVLFEKIVELNGIPTPVPGITIGLSGGVKIILSQLKIGAGLELDITGDSLKLKDEGRVGSGTYLHVQAKVDGPVAISGSAALALGGWNLVRFFGTVGAQVTIGIDLRLAAAGPVLTPTFSLDRANSTAFVAVFITTQDWDIDLLNQEPTVAKKLEGKPITNADAEKGLYSELFGLQKPKDFANFNAGNKYGPVSTKDGNAALGQDNAAGLKAASMTDPMRLAAAVEPPIVASVTLQGVADDALKSFRYDVQVHADRASLSAGKHSLQTVLIKAVDNTEIILDESDLASGQLTLTDPYLGFATGFVTRNVAVPAAVLADNQFYRLMVRFQSDRAGTGESVVVELKNGKITSSGPVLKASSKFGLLDGRRVDFGPDSGGSTRSILYLENTGVAPLVISKITASAGFKLGYPIELPAVIQPGSGTLAFAVDALSASTAATGTLTILSNDTSSPAFNIGLRSVGGLSGLPPVALVDSDLVIRGTAANDIVAVSAGTMPGSVKVTINGSDKGTFIGANRIVAKLAAGDDRFESDANLDKPMLVYGGDGIDNVVTGMANDIIFGGDGIDVLSGGLGTNQIVADSAPPALTTSPTAKYVENTTPTVLSPSATVIDEDTSAFEFGRLKISIVSGAASTDRLSIRNQGGGLNRIGITGGVITYSNITIGSFTPPSDSQPLTINLNKNASIATTQSLLRNITFTSLGDAPVPGARVISYVLADGERGVSRAVLTTLTVVAINDAPVLTNATSSTLNYVRTGPPIELASAVEIVDADSVDFDKGKLTISYVSGSSTDNVIELSGTLFQRDSSGRLLRSGVVIGTLIPNAGIGATRFEVTFNGQATASVVKQLLAALRFRIASGSDNSARQLSISLSDGDGGVSNKLLQTITVS